MLRRAASPLVHTSFAVGVLCALLSACGSSTDQTGFGDGGFGGGGGGGGGGGSFGGDGGTGDLGDAACATSSSKGQQAPLDIYIMLDQSGSMKDSNKWPSVTAAINAFVSSPQTGVSVGLQYFALPPGASGGGNGCTNGKACTTAADCGGAANGSCIPFANVCLCNSGLGGGDSCNAADYAKAEVEIAALPGVAPTIKASIAQHSPSTSTPTSAALQGAVDHAAAWAKAHPGHVAIALLATDGDPTECDTNIANIQKIASTAAAGTPKILTFVIGVGLSSGNLNAIASAGGTGQAYIVDANANAQAQFLAALNQIRGTALGCAYSIPAPPTGGTLNFGNVNVRYTPSNGGPVEVIPKVNDASACPASGDAWYYDNATAPTQIILCASTCTKVLADKNGEVDVLLGCATRVR